MMENDHQQQRDGEEREAEFTMSLSCLNVYQNHRPDQPLFTWRVWRTR